MQAALSLAVTAPATATGGAAAATYTGVIGNGRFHSQVGTSAGPYAESRYPVTILDDIAQGANIRVAFTNFAIQAGGGATSQPDERGGNQVMTIDKAALEYNGNYYPLYFSGARSGSIEAVSSYGTTPNAVGVTLCDNLAAPVAIPAGATVYVRFLVHCTSSAGICFRTSQAITGCSTSWGSQVAVGDHVDATGTFSNVNAAATASIPVACIIGPTTKKTVGFIGDSITTDVSGRYNTTADPADGRIGYATGLDTGIGFINFGSPSLEAATCLTRSSSRKTLYQYVSHMFVALGTNDFAVSTSVATTKAALQGIAAACPANQYKFVCTVIPRGTTSTDFWLTAANQTVPSNTLQTNRAAFNTDIRTNGLSGFNEVADFSAVFEDPGNSQKWKDSAVGATVTDGAMASTSSNVLTSATAPFLSTDVPTSDNAHVMVVGAGAGGTNLTARIGTFTNTGSVGLITSASNANNQNAGTIVSGATVYLRPYCYDNTHPTTVGYAMFRSNGIVMTKLNAAPNNML